MPVTVSSLDEYQALCLRTLNDEGTSRNILHCILGVAGEVGEVTELIGSGAHAPNGLVGELGDCMWYAAVLAKQFDVRLSLIAVPAFSPNQIPEHRELNGMVVYAAQMIEVIKKYEFYKKEFPPEKVLGPLSNYLYCLLEVCRFNCLDPIDVAYANINKLAARYPDKFTFENAVNRNNEAESAASGTLII